MAAWRDCKLGDLLEIKHGYAFLGEHFANAGSHIVLTPGNFYDEGGFKHKGEKEKWYNGPIPTDYVLKGGDLIVAMTEQAEGLLGSSAVIPRGGLYLHNQRLGLVQVRDETKADKRFLYYVFNSKPVRQQIRGSASGTKIRHTAPSRIADVKVSVPPLQVQRQIGAILSAYDHLIENNTRRIQILERMAQAIYREWFVNFRFPGHTKVKLVASPLGKLPHGWRAGTFSDITEISRSSLNPAQFPDEQFSHYSIPAFDADHMPLLERGETILSNKFLLENDCVLLSKLNPRIARIWLPKLNGAHRAIASTEFLALQPRSSFTLTQLFCLCSSEEFQSVFAGRALGTSTSHQRVKPEDLMRLPTVLPTANVVGVYTEQAKPILSLVHTLRVKNANLRRTRDLLLPRLLSGQVEVLTGK
jgi:type I restriction enzyme S subunit